MARTYKILSVLLSYPTEALQEAAPEFAAVLEGEALLPPAERQAVQTLIDEMAERDLFDLQERYVLLFDRSRSLSLHMFEHIHGESRDRGQAMVDLLAMYERHGFTVTARELPDYLPMFLEFLSLLPEDEAAQLLGEPLHVIEALYQRLLKRKSPYAAVFTAMKALAGGKADEKIVAELLQEPDDDPEDLEALDRIWEEEAVTFGPTGPGGVDGQAGCPLAENLVRRFAPEEGSAKIPAGSAGHTG